MSCLCWPANNNLFLKFSRFVRGLPPSPTDDDNARDQLICSLFLPSGREECEETTLPRITTSSPAAAKEQEQENKENKEMVLPCVVLPTSQSGLVVFSLADDGMCGDVRLPVCCRPLVPSPYGGRMFATDLFGRQLDSLVDPFTGEWTPLPRCMSDEAHAGRTEPAVAGFAWDWSPRGVVVARGDMVFFCESGGGSWTPVHRSWRNSPMTVNYSGGFFFVLEALSLLTTVIDTATLDRFAVIGPPPRCSDIDAAYLVASPDDVLLLVHRAGDKHRKLFSQVYRAKHTKRRRRGSPEWAEVTDVGDRALFVDRVHGFSVPAAAAERAAGPRRNCVYSIVGGTVKDPSGRTVAATYDVAAFRVESPEEVAPLRSELRRCMVQHTWGEPFWMVRKVCHRRS